MSRGGMGSNRMPMHARLCLWGHPAAALPSSLPPTWPPRLRSPHAPFAWPALPPAAQSGRQAGRIVGVANMKRGWGRARQGQRMRQPRAGRPARAAVVAWAEIEKGRGGQERVRAASPADRRSIGRAPTRGGEAGTAVRRDNEEGGRRGLGNARAVHCASAARVRRTSRIDSGRRGQAARRVGARWKGGRAPAPRRGGGEKCAQEKWESRAVRLGRARNGGKNGC
jgi:hypothetical protein